MVSSYGDDIIIINLKIMLLNEFQINEIEKYIYMKNINKYCVIICLFMDDMLILDNNDYMINFTKKMLTNKFRHCLH